MQGYVLDNLYVAVGQHKIHYASVVAQCRRRKIVADDGKACQLAQALYPAVLAVFSVKHGEHGIYTVNCAFAVGNYLYNALVRHIGAYHA